MDIKPTRTMLLVIDMQRDFYGDGGNTQLRGKGVAHMQSLPEKINSFAEKLRPLGVRVVFTKFIYEPLRSPSNYTEIVQTAKNNNWLCEEGSEGASLDGVAVEQSDVVVEKLTYDCFSGTPLLQMATSWDITNVIVTGVRTEVCIFATASRSFAEGYRTFVVSDLIGTQDEKMPITKNILDALAYTSHITTGQEMLKLLSRSS